MTPESEWIRRFAPSLPPGSQVLDLACGSGRHTRFLADAGHRVTAVDRDLTQIADLVEHEFDRGAVEMIEADLESPVDAQDPDGARWPADLEGRQFGCVVVTNYLHRPLFGAILRSVAPGGMLLYETFARGHEELGRPRNPAYLLRPGELLDVVKDELDVVAFEQGMIPACAARPSRAMIQRICAVRPPGEAGSVEVRL